MKIGIVIPLKAQAVSTDWHVTCSNVESTVNSVISQNDSRFQCVVIGHDKPKFMNKFGFDQKCYFKTATNLPLPEVDGGVEANQLKYEADRCTKILIGIIELKQRYPDITHWFALDADDLVHNRFVEILQMYGEKDGIILDKGYFLYKNTGIINVEDEFSAYCGSSAVLSDKFMSFSENVDAKDFRSIPFGSISHVHMRETLLNSGHSVGLPQERLVMYVRDNGENISNVAYYNTPYKIVKKNIKMLLRAKKLSPDIRSSFGI